MTRVFIISPQEQESGKEKKEGRKKEKGGKGGKGEKSTGGAAALARLRTLLACKSQQVEIIPVAEAAIFPQQINSLWKLFGVDCLAFFDAGALLVLWVEGSGRSRRFSRSLRHASSR